MNAKTTSKKNQVVSKNIFEREELVKKAEEISKTLRASSWKDLETHGKFAKNDKISFISDDMLVAGCDIGSETHYLRAIDTRGRELSPKAFPFRNNAEGFASAKAWLLELAARHGKTQIVVGLEPTGHYWFCLAAWLVSNGISVVQVNPYAVKQTKELEDNSQRKDDLKDPKLIANLVKDGNYGMPYLPEGNYADIRRYALFRDQLMEDRTRAVNRLHRELTICFPEYKDAFGKVDGAFTMALLQVAPFPADLKAIGADGIRDLWHAAKLRGRGYSRAEEIIRYAEQSVGLQDGVDASREAVIHFAGQVAACGKPPGNPGHRRNHPLRHHLGDGRPLPFRHGQGNPEDERHEPRRLQLRQTPRRNQDQPSREEAVAVLAVPSSQIRDVACVGIQGDPRVLHNARTQPPEEDAVAGRHRLQAPSGHLCHLQERHALRSKEDAAGHPEADQHRNASRCVIRPSRKTYLKDEVPGLCRAARKRSRAEQGPGRNPEKTANGICGCRVHCLQYAQKKLVGKEPDKQEL